MRSTFRGAIVRSRWDRGWPFGKLTLTADELAIRGPFTCERFARSAPLTSRVERSPLPLWARVVWFDDGNDDRERIGFVPHRLTRLVAALDHAGIAQVTQEPRRPRWRRWRRWRR